MIRYSIVIPAYNEEKRIEKTIISIENFFKDSTDWHETIVVNDGSKDKTTEIVKINQNKFEKIKLIEIIKNTGKGNAIKVGTENSSGDYILFTDADNSTPIEEITNFKKYSNDYEIIIGSRKLEKSIIEIEQPIYRKIIAKIGDFFISKIIKDIKDTQCGFKLIKKEVAAKIFSKQKINRFGFDIEFLAIAQLYNFKIIELPIKWKNMNGSTFRPMRDSFLTMKDLIIIYYNLFRKKY
jgi:dolichyl-phosphate beta-glucosyltransferase